MLACCQSLGFWPGNEYFCLYSPPYCHCFHWWISWWLELEELVLVRPLPWLAVSLLSDMKQHEARVTSDGGLTVKRRTNLYILLTSGGWLVSWLLNNDKYSPWITVGLLSCCRTDWTLCVDCGLQAGSQRRKEKAGELRCLRCEISCHDTLQTPQLLHHHI